MKEITIKGARIHNLKGFDISIPKNKLVVATGISGSGKSSLVFDIIFEEGRRQYLRSLGVLSGIPEDSGFDSVSGIGPTIAVQQSIIRQSNPRSTVGSRTNILNMLGVLYASEGQITCSSCKKPVDKNLACKNCGIAEERLEASYFSYNAPNGMCNNCSGRGASYEIDMEQLVPDKITTLEQVFDTVGVTPGYKRLLYRLFEDHIKTPFAKIPDDVKHEIIYGHYVDNNYLKRSYCLTRIFQGRLVKNGEDPSGLYTMSNCSECHGFRVGEEARRVLLNGKHIGQLASMSIDETKKNYESLLKFKGLSSFGKSLLKEILRKTNHLIDSRLGYLSLYREIPTLSGGELQRLFLHAHLDSEMDSLIYILDEPTVGLHESEKIELLKSIVALRELGNSVIVVEHDRNMIEMADHVIDIGPGAGVEGGELIYQGEFRGLLKNKKSLTGQYLSGKAVMPGKAGKNSSPDDENTPCLTIRNSSTNNLVNVTVSVPLGFLVGIAGVSGSGKSSLISDTLIPLLRKQLGEDWNNSAVNIGDSETEGDAEPSVIHTLADKLEGLEHISGVAEVSQAPIGRNINSNPATYIGIWDKIRKLFASQPEARKRKLTAGHFSFNSKGACSACGGSGKETILLGGQLKMYNTCPECHGKRYNEEALSVNYKGKNIFDVLEMRVTEAVSYFKDSRGITATLEIMQRIGMGYIGLGQPTPSLSGGEAQRIKLAKEIAKRRKGNTLYVLDEPTTGLSLYDTARLIHLLNELVANGNSAIVIEHDPTILAACDWIIELGPGGGTEGGRIIAENTPEALAKNHQSVTGKYLKSSMSPR